MALIVRPAEECPAVVREVAARGVRFAIVYAAGFAEKGRRGPDLQRALVAAARTGPTRLVGPNGMNVFSAPARLNLSGIVPFPEGDLGFLSASGNLGYAFAQEAAATRRPGLLALRERRQPGRPRPRRVPRLPPGRRGHTGSPRLPGGSRSRPIAPFLEAVARTAARKPVLILRGGRTRTGQRTARSHTAALSPAPEVMRAALEQAGAVLLDRADEALAVAESFLASPLPAGRRSVLVGEGGGHATLSTDTAVESGLELPAAPRRPGRAPPPAPAALRRDREQPRGDGRGERAGPAGLREGAASRSSPGRMRPGRALRRLRPLRRGHRGVPRASAERPREPVLLHDLYAGETRPAFDGPAGSRPSRLRLGRRGRALRGRALARHGGPRARAARRAPGPSRRRAGGGRAPELPPDLAAASHGRGLAARAALRRRRRAAPRPFRGDRARAALATAPRRPWPRRSAWAIRWCSSSTPRRSCTRPRRAASASTCGGPRRCATRFGLAGRAAPRPARRTCVRLTPYRPGGVEVLVGARRDPELGPLLVVGVGGVAAETLAEVAIRTLPCAPEDIGDAGEGALGRLLAHARGTAAPSTRALSPPSTPWPA